MQVVGWVLGGLFGAGLGLFLIWLAKAPFRTGRYVARSVRAHDVRNRETLGQIPPGVTPGHTRGFSGDDRDLLRQTDDLIRDMKGRGGSR